MAYARKNLGDDLFIKMLLDQNKEIDFYIKIDKYEFVDWLDGYENLHVLNGKDTDKELYEMNVEEYDAYVYIGGSIFIEGGKVYNLSPKFYDFIKRCNDKKIPFCYISCNYGPYQTQEYFELSRNTFQECTDICFRDKYSYNLFRDINTVRYAPDLAFSYELEKEEKIPNSIGISIINLAIREKLQKKEEEYDEFLINNIKKYIRDGNTVYLYSFCEHEGDDVAIDKILQKLKNTSKVIPVRYKGDINYFLKMYSKMEYMICSRFHAMILSCIARQKMYIMSYSKKIDNVIEDLSLKVPILHFDEIVSDKEIELEQFKTVEDKQIEEIIQFSKEQSQAFSKAISK